MAVEPNTLLEPAPLFSSRIRSPQNLMVCNFLAWLQQALPLQPPGPKVPFLQTQQSLPRSPAHPLRTPPRPPSCAPSATQLEEDFIRSNPDWVAELELMLKTKEKAEIQALSSFGFQVGGARSLGGMPM